MRILIGVDESPHSDAAVEFVKRMGWPEKTRVLVLSAVQPASRALAEVYAAGAGATDRSREDRLRAREELSAMVERKLGDSGLRTEARVVEGDPRTALVDAARDARADLVVVGSHGRTGLDRLVMGSVASYVVAHAPCSVLVVKLGPPIA